MRIDQKADPGAVSLESTDRAENGARTGQGAGARGKGGDSVQLSSDAQLLHSALKAASEPGANRADKIEQARQKFESGELGRDANRLADRLIDDLLGR